MKRKLTKKDPQKEISSWLDYQAKPVKGKSAKLSASLPKLKRERHRSLFRNLGLIIFVSLLTILSLGYYISPQANVKYVKVLGAKGLDTVKVVNASGIKPTGKVLSYCLNQHRVNRNITNHYVEIAHSSVQVNQLNHLTLRLTQYKIIGYIREDHYGYKILATGQISKQRIPLKAIDATKPLFVGYNHKTACKTDIAVFRQLPQSVQSEVKMMSGETQRPTQIILVMKDGNVIIGNVDTIIKKIKYYPTIKHSLKTASVVDLEVGAYSRALSQQEKARYGLIK